jgi:hypothetical protein
LGPIIFLKITPLMISLTSRGLAIIIPGSEQKLVNKTDDIIRILDPYNSDEFLLSYGSAEKRLEKLFEIKDKWIIGELKVYLQEFIELGVNFDSYLLKNTSNQRKKSI